ncbi:MAG: hypothetical protein HXY39_04285 [Chloroflexi bacterium]|nr:hypothetical protein [Chloroflexota bacterium]
MKIALVALPRLEEPRATPPLPLCYVAALLEQQRHIVRVYDLALPESVPHGDRLDAVRAFRPQLTVVAAERVTDAEKVAATLHGLGPVLPVGLGMRDHLPARLPARALNALSQPFLGQPDEKNVIAYALLALEDDLDRLPIPARHLIPLERYPHVTPDGDLQTPVLIGRVRNDGSFAPRQPPLVIAELRTIAQEHGIRHIIFSGAALTDDILWLRDLLKQLASSRLGIKWMGRVSYARLTHNLLEECRRTGCEALTFEFSALSVLDLTSERTALTGVIQQARALGMRVNANIHLDPLYESIPAVVDMSATFGLDDVRFIVPRHVDQEQRDDEAPELESIVALARTHYQASRSRQYFINRFGTYLGTMIWHAGRAGLLGRKWQHYALNHESLPDIAIQSGNQA